MEETIYSFSHSQYVCNRDDRDLACELLILLRHSEILDCLLTSITVGYCSHYVVMST